MTNDQLKLLYIQMQIDNNINGTRKIIKDIYNYMNDDNQLIENEILLDELENADYMLKNGLELIEKLAEIYESMENKNF